jgi:hypothetical protein
MVPLGISYDTDRYQLALAKSNRRALAIRTNLVARRPAMAYRSASTIDNLLADALIRKVMRADGVEPQALKVLLEGTARRLAESRRARPAQIGPDLGRRSPFRAPLLLMGPAARTSGGGCGASRCG